MLCFCILFLSVSISSCKAEDEMVFEKEDLIISADRDIRLSQPENKFIPSDINGGSLFYIHEEKLIEYNIATDEKTTLKDGLTAAGGFFVTGGKTYIHDFEKNCVTEYDEKFNTVNEYLLNEKVGESVKLIKSGDTVLILAKTTESNYADKIYKINVKDNTQGYINIKNSMYISDVFFTDSENILVIHFNTASLGQITKYNLTDEKSEFTVSDDIISENICYDIKSGYLYILSITSISMDVMYENAEIIKAEISDGKLNIISAKKYKNLNSESARSFYANESGYIIWYRDNFVAARKFSEDAGNILNIYINGTGGTWFENSVRDFQRDYGAEINMVALNDYSSDKIKLKLLANDTDFDLFIIDTPTGIDIFTKGAYEPLDAYPGVMKNIGEMYPGMQKLLKYNGSTVGIPTLQEVGAAWAFNDELAKKYDIDMPVTENGIWTIDEYYEYAKYVKEKSGGAVYVNSIFWIGAYMTEYINPATGEMTDGGENLKRILKWSKDLADLWDDDVFSDYENNLFYTGSSSLPYSMKLRDETMIPIPVINKTSKIPTWYLLLCINKYSENKELAAQFLEYMTAEKHRYERMAPILFNEIDKYKIYETEITDRMRFNSDYLNILYENSMFEYQVKDDNFLGFYNELTDKYMNGEISLDSTANELYNKLKMICGG